MTFNDREKELLLPYVSSADKNVFVVSGLPGIVGAVFARYSRAQTGFRETLLNEFLRDGKIDPKKADELIQRVLIAYGDDSVGELEGVHLSLERISNLATKEIEDRRIGGSAIEQSTRYVRYDCKDEQGKFNFLRESRIMASEFGREYEDTLTFVFESYHRLVQDLQDFFERLKPINEAEYAVVQGDLKKYKLVELRDEKYIKAFRTTYNNDLRTRACDTSRVLLPAATLTNVGIYGNGRFFQNLLSHLFTLEVAEMDDIGSKAYSALNTIIPQYVRRAGRNDYIVTNDKNMQELVDHLFSNLVPKNGNNVVLVENPKSDEEYIDMLIAEMLYKYTKHPLNQVREVVSHLYSEEKLDIFRTYIGSRKSRRDRPGRALEFGYPLTFDIVGDFGIYRDLERHRMLTQERQRLNTDLGFSMPDEIVEAGFKSIVDEAVDRVANLHSKLQKSFPYESQYVILFGFNMRWMMGMNPREAMHMLELRTTPQGHPNYRRVCQKMHDLIGERYPLLRDAMSFVDHEFYYWNRAESEAAQRRKGE